MRPEKNPSKKVLVENDKFKMRKIRTVAKARC